MLGISGWDWVALTFYFVLTVGIGVFTARKVKDTTDFFMAGRQLGILVTAAAEDTPGPLLAELKTGGIMVLPVGQSDQVQSLIKVTRTESGYDYEELLPVRFVPLVEGMGQD